MHRDQYAITKLTYAETSLFWVSYINANIVLLNVWSLCAIIILNSLMTLEFVFACPPSAYSLSFASCKGCKLLNKGLSQCHILYISLQSISKSKSWCIDLLFSASILGDVYQHLLKNEVKIRHYGQENSSLKNVISGASVPHMC